MAKRESADTEILRAQIGVGELSPFMPDLTRLSGKECWIALIALPYLPCAPGAPGGPMAWVPRGGC